jgi:Arc/MetJ-type ribon-helix-helix transcriptional regulator
MKRKAYSGKSTQIVKTSITLPEVLVRFIEGKMADDGYPTLSSYLVELLHRAKERDEERQLGLGKSSSSTSSYSPAPAKRDSRRRSRHRAASQKEARRIINLQDYLPGLTP